MAALSIFHALVNCLNTAWLSKIASTYAVIHIAVLFSCCVALLVLQKDKNTASYVFTEVSPDSGWSPPGFSFLFGFLSVAWGKLLGEAYDISLSFHGLVLISGCE
jgi:amino acid transporter